MAYSGPKSRGGNERNSRTTHPDKKRRREEAVERQEKYSALSDEQKVDIAGKKQLNKFIKQEGNIVQLAEHRLAELNNATP